MDKEQIEQLKEHPRFSSAEWEHAADLYIEKLERDILQARFDVKTFAEELEQERRLRLLAQADAGNLLEWVILAGNLLPNSFDSGSWIEVMICERDVLLAHPHPGQALLDRVKELEAEVERASRVIFLLTEESYLPQEVVADRHRGEAHSKGEYWTCKCNACSNWMVRAAMEKP